jgi:hypothetical protein
MLIRDVGILERLEGGGNVSGRVGYGVDVTAVVGVVSGRLRGHRIIEESKGKGIMRGVRRVDDEV